MDGGTMVAYLELDAAGYRQAMSQAEQEARRFAAASPPCPRAHPAWRWGAKASGSRCSFC